MAKYISYYDDWNGSFMVMNAQDRQAAYRATAYNLDGSQVWTEHDSLSPHQTKVINLDKLNKKGMIVIEPITTGDEFPSSLYLYTGDFDVVPFTRIP